MDALKFYAHLKNIMKVAKSNPDGFTYNLQDGTMQDEGFAVARRETQNSFGEVGLCSCLVFAIQNGVPCVGGWYNSENGEYYFDATEIYSDKAQAISAGRDNEQIAIFNLNACEEIRL